MADKTPPYIPEDCLPVEEVTGLRSEVVRTNSFFCQSLLREMSENSLILLPSAKISNEDLANCNSYSSESKENSSVTPDSLFKLIRRCSGMEKTSVSGNMFNDQIIKMPSNLPTYVSSEETSKETVPEVPMNRFCSANTHISSKEVEVPTSQAPSKEFSLKRSRNLLIEGESEASLEKRARVSEEVGTAEQAPSEGTMTDTKVKSGVSPNEDKSGQTAEKEAVISEAIITSEKSTDVPTAGSGKMSQRSSYVPNQQNTSSIAFDKEKASEDKCSEGDRCSVCGKTNCPLDPKQTSKISPISMPQKSLFGKLKSSRKSKQSQLNVMIAKRTKTTSKRYINTRSSTNRLAKRIVNHTPLHVFKLKGQLFKAVEDGDMVRMQELIQDTGVTVRKNKTRCTLLHVAATYNQPDMVMFLLKSISPNVTNKEGQTPAHVAAEKGHTQVLNILVRDSDFEADKRDNRHNTVKSLLGGHLFKAILEGNTKEAERLVELGADPDSHGGKLVNGLLARELGVTTPRLLANALSMEWAVTMFAKKARNDKKTDETGCQISAALNSVQLKVPTRQFHVRHATAIQGGADVYKMDKEARGFVRIFNFSSFKDRSVLKLQQLDYDALIMSDVFDNMGYKCKTHASLTAQQTKEVLKNIRDADELTDVGCAIFVISGYSVNGRKVLTSDMKSVDIDYILNLFKDSECPRLKDKPKLFIFNLYNLSEGITTSCSETLKVKRLTDPLNDMACIYSNNIGLNCIPNGKGTAFNWCLCRTLAEHAADQELCDFYREFLKKYNNSSSTFSPELRYFGFTKKFFFNPM
ncbi:uncharacterized protein LOC125037023 [Penaeus chinensis]|uniref:uncharacterized protein LOC125037023 n=1 Tax=Penaeus chinensis TaxID=139456 RepID=UPI001FB71C13|nr:uncharacterized protein LOC125037023 [Penaeus chinensis]XP_047485941.1 uncharacterized protein LOC125037023 [Penaeus chinensis]